MPDWLRGPAERLHSEGWFGRVPDQAIVNEYLPGQGIAAHVDCEPCFGNTIASVSLGSSCVMTLTRGDGLARHDLLLEPRSLLVLSGPARREWKHGIAARKSDFVNGSRVARGRRLSITFRTVRFEDGPASEA